MKGLPLFKVVPFLVQTHITSGEGPTHLKLTAKGENMAYIKCISKKSHIYKENYII